MTRSTLRRRDWFLRNYLVTATILFGILVVLANNTNYFPLDLSITRSVQSIDIVGFADLMRVVSVVGYSPQVFVLITSIVLMLFMFRWRWEAVTALLAAVGGSSAGGVIKIIVHRSRPTADLVRISQQLDDFSFPSGHVLLYTSFFGFLLFLTYQLLQSSWRRTALLIILGSLIGLIGLSRIYLGEHWVSDVIGGYLLGSVWLTMSIYVYQQRVNKCQDQANAK